MPAHDDARCKIAGQECGICRGKGESHKPVETNGLPACFAGEFTATNDPELEKIDAGDVRELLTEDLFQITAALFKFRDGLNNEDIALIIPRYKRERFSRSLGEAKSALLRAIDMLSRKESPTTETMVADLIDRWQTLREHERQAVVGLLREAFRAKVLPVKRNDERQPSKGAK